MMKTKFHNMLIILLFICHPLIAGQGSAGAKFLQINTTTRGSANAGTMVARPGLIDACLKDSVHRKTWALDQVKKIGLNLKKSKIAILGLAYKPGTNSIKNSPSVELIKNLRNSVLNLHDPLVQNHSTQKNTIFFSNPLSAIKGCDALIVMTPWQQYKRLPLEKICKLLTDSFEKCL